MTPLAIQAMGVFASNGGSAPVVMGSVLSTVQVFGDLDLTGPDGEQLGGAVTPLARSVRGIDRLAAMALAALTECAGDDPRAVAPLLVLAPASADLGEDPRSLIDAFPLLDAALPIDRAAIQVLTGGRGEIARALLVAGQTLAAGSHDACYLLAVDSLVVGTRLRRLVDRGAVIYEGNPDGIVPGEAAVALRLSPADRGPALAHLVALGEGDEPAARASDDGETALTGQGYTTAVRAALRAFESRGGGPGRDGDRDRGGDTAVIRALIVDRAGPQLRLEELALARQRRPLSGIANDVVFMPALSAGDTGAAAGLLGVATAAFFVDRGVIDGPVACLFTGDDDWRGAAIVVRPTSKDDRNRNASEARAHA